MKENLCDSLPEWEVSPERSCSTTSPIRSPGDNIRGTLRSKTTISCQQEGALNLKCERAYVDFGIIRRRKLAIECIPEKHRAVVRRMVRHVGSGLTNGV